MDGEAAVPDVRPTVVLRGLAQAVHGNDDLHVHTSGVLHPAEGMRKHLACLPAYYPVPLIVQKGGGSRQHTHRGGAVGRQK